MIADSTAQVDAASENSAWRILSGSQLHEAANRSIALFDAITKGESAMRSARQTERIFLDLPWSDHVLKAPGMGIDP
ncbi:hypothetical protein EB815_18745 [Mesorhizobium loti]|jgi:hypothetical protein|uniref:Uncharacterized protein n=1 Tax=Rhizobium loti TaxID=381 RepID=A0A6M7U2X5_RHILI|nr:hypothetical protein ASE05_16885 [Mesorhizobium sp. Root172]OBQ61891.1 hypothetical protein A8145_19515 [Mesorhizobium loti]QKC70946.1 hypothetical protein EB815_18745 [Mesorhizobium loti]